MYTLVVVDMQHKFDAALRPEVQEHCKKAITKAIKNKASIIFLEYQDHGPTLPELTVLTKEYKKTFHATKNDWDGSAQALNIVKEKRLPKKKFRICGVYTNCCVKATLYGLRDAVLDSKFELIDKACGGTTDYSQKKTLDEFRSMDRIKIV